MAVSPVFGELIPSQKQQALQSNYLQFNDAAGDDFSSFAQQYLPEIYEAEVERYGNRTLSGFLRMVGAEMPMTSDQVIWSEQTRLHIAYESVSYATATTVTFAQSDDVQNVISKNATVVLYNPADGAELKCLVTSSTAGGNTGTATIGVLPYTQADLDGGGAGEVSFTALTGGELKIFVYGSEYGKGTDAQDIKTVTPQFKQFSNSPIIIKDKFAINGSDTAQIGWVEVATEAGQSGFLWYLKAESETRLRFEDYLEMSLVEAEKVGANSGITGLKGTEGLFAAVKDRGNTVAGLDTSNLSDFDSILKNLDTQGAIEENMLFLNRGLSLGIDDMLAGAAQNGGSAYQGGSAYGIFENSEEMALNLGFSGFRRGSYDFYKTDWKYLNDASTRGASTQSGIEGILIPAGTSTVYDQILGTNIRRPFLHVRYRASQADDRRMKSWVTGSVGAATSDLDAMEVHFLSERCLCVQGANNFVLFTA